MVEKGIGEVCFGEVNFYELAIDKARLFEFGLIKRRVVEGALFKADG